MGGLCLIWTYAGVAAENYTLKDHFYLGNVF